MQIAAQHPEAVRESAGMSMEERLLLDGIALHTRGISPWHIELAAAVKAHFAYAGLSLGDRAAMTAREASDAIVAEILNQRGFCLVDSFVENVTQGRQSGTSACILSRDDAAVLVLSRETLVQFEGLT
jgi:hypothetical protein